MQYTIVTLLLTYVYDFRVSSLMRTKCWTAICLYPQWMLSRHKTTMVGNTFFICVYMGFWDWWFGRLVVGKHGYHVIITHDDILVTIWFCISEHSTFNTYIRMPIVSRLRHTRNLSIVNKYTDQPVNVD